MHVLLWLTHQHTCMPCHSCNRPCHPWHPTSSPHQNIRRMVRAAAYLPASASGPASFWPCQLLAGHSEYTPLHHDFCHCLSAAAAAPGRSAILMHDTERTMLTYLDPHIKFTGELASGHLHLATICSKSFCFVWCSSRHFKNQPSKFLL